MNKITMTLFISAMTFGLAGCVVTPEASPYNAVKIVDSDAVVSCRHISNISTSSTTPYGLFSGSAYETVIDLAKKQGLKLGATHLVLNAPTSANDTVSLEGRAYVCSP